MAEPTTQWADAAAPAAQPVEPLENRVAWTTRILVIVLLPAILASHWWVPFAQIPFVGELLEKVVDLALAFVMFKALSREARRYLEVRNSP